MGQHWRVRERWSRVRKFLNGSGPLPAQRCPRCGRPFPVEGGWEHMPHLPRELCSYCLTGHEPGWIEQSRLDRPRWAEVPRSERVACWIIGLVGLALDVWIFVLANDGRIPVGWFIPIGFSLVCAFGLGLLTWRVVTHATARRDRSTGANQTATRDRTVTDRHE